MHFRYIIAIFINGLKSQDFLLTTTFIQIRGQFHIFVDQFADQVDIISHFQIIPVSWIVF